MRTQQKIKYSVILLMVFNLFMAGPFTIITLAANYPLEIINIKPAGTGSPPIPSTNRIFRAYPGIEYNIRAAVIGGVYPYTYSLSNAPPGMTINPRTGEIVWPNPQSSASNIQLTVVDSESTQVQTTWSITVTTSGFLFVDASYSGPESGSITQPYSSLANLFKNQTNNPTAIVYFRSGTYSMPSESLGNCPHNWLAYPGESVTIDMQQRQGVWTEHSPYFDGITFTNMLNHGIHFYGPRHYQTIRRCVYDGITTNISLNENQGFMPFLASEGDNGFYTVIQDNVFKNYKGTNAIGSMYRMSKTLIENNYIYNCLGTSPTGWANAIAPKYRIQKITVRGNKVVIGAGRAIGGINSAFWGGSTDIEINFNLFVKTGGEREAHLFNHEYDQGKTYYFRNTLVADIIFRGINGNNCGASGPWYVNGNIIINPNSSWNDYLTVNYLSYEDYTGQPQNCIIDINNLKGTASANIVDSNYNLTPEYSSYLGTRGWQFSDGLTPMTPTIGNDTEAPSVPTNLSATSVSSSRINLSWTASTDNMGVTGYRIYRCQGSGCSPTSQIATSPTNSYSDTGLSPSTTYVYKVAAYDAAGNVSAQSSSASATTPADTTPPQPPPILRLLLFLIPRLTSPGLPLRITWGLLVTKSIAVRELPAHRQSR